MPFSIAIVNSDISLNDPREDLLLWYRAHRRVLPWRAAPHRGANPYHVMVSEFMLQQTTVQTVIPYFLRFTERFPTVQALACATQDEVYALWQGLGYYSRARNLHKAAQQIADMPNFPSTVESLKALPGIGDYTSAAIAAIAFNQSVVPVDGNVMRVMARYALLEEVKGPKLAAPTMVVAEQFAGQHDNSESAQAMMELGALVCKPKNPTCEICPLAKGCKAYGLEQVDQYPKLPLKKKRPKRIGTVFVIQNESGEYLLQQRPETGLFANLFICPTTIFQMDLLILPQLVELCTINKPISHIFSHFELTLTVVHAKIAPGIKIPGTTWVKLHSLSEYGMPSLMHPVLQSCRQHMQIKKPLE